MAQTLRTVATVAPAVVALLAVDGLTVAAALPRTHKGLAACVRDLVLNGMLRHAAPGSKPRLAVGVDLATGDMSVGTTPAGNLLEVLGLPKDRRTMSVDLGCRQPVETCGALRRALGLGLADAVAMAKSTRPVTLDRGDLVATLVEVLDACGRRNARIEDGLLLDAGVAAMERVLRPRVA